MSNAYRKFDIMKELKESGMWDELRSISNIIRALRSKPYLIRLLQTANECTQHSSNILEEAVSAMADRAGQNANREFMISGIHGSTPIYKINSSLGVLMSIGIIEKVKDRTPHTYRFVSPAKLIEISDRLKNQREIRADDNL